MKAKNAPAKRMAKTWEIGAVKSVPKFLAAVSEHLASAHTVSFEVRDECAGARGVYLKHRSSARFRPLRDTIFPRTRLYYCTISASLAKDLHEVLRSHPVNKVFWHLKGYGDRKLLFAIHDADCGFPAFLSGQIGSKVVRAIASKLRRKADWLQTAFDWDEDLNESKRLLR